MAINNDYNKKLQNMPNSMVENSPVESPAVASEPASTPVPIVSDSNTDVTKKSVEISEEARQKADAEAQEARKARATSHQNEVDEVASLKAASTEVSPEKRSQVINEYKDVIKNQSITPEQKVFLILKQYYTKHDAEFAKLTEEEQRNYINQKINDELMADKKDLSVREKKLFARDLCTLILEADMRGISLDKLASNSKEDNAVLIKNAKKENFALLLDELQNTNNDKSSEILISMYLENTDDNYAQLSLKDKSEYVKNIKDKMSSNFMLNGISPEKQKAISKITITVLKQLNEDGINIAEFKKMPVEKQNRTLLDAITKPEIYQTLSNEEQQFVDELSLKQNIGDILNEKGKEFNEGNIYEYLIDLKNNHKLSDEEQKLLKDYELLKKCGKFDPNEKPSLNGNFLVAKAAGVGVKDYAKEVLKDLKPGTEKYNEVIEELTKRANNDNSAFCTAAIIDAAKELGWSKKQIAEFLKQLNIEKNIAADDEGLATAKLVSDVSEYGNEKLKDGIKNVIRVAVVERDDIFSVNGMSNITHDPNNEFTDVFTSAINNDSNRSLEQKLSIYKASISNSKPERKSAITQSSIETASNEQKIYYGNEYSQIIDSAVTQGLAAAAHNETNAEIKSQLNAYVDNAIKNNAYSSEEVKNINTARETGQTSYERNAVSSDSNNTSNTNSTNANSTLNKAANNTTTNPASAQNPTSVATASSTAGASSSSVVKISQQTKPYVAELRTQLDDLAKKSLQASYEHSLAEREKTLNSLQAIIDKIRDDQELHAQKQAELAKKEAKTDEEIAQAIKEADAKSAEEQKQAQEQITNETIAEIEQQEKLEKKYHISAETIEVLRNAQKQGDLSTIYTKLGEISADAQKHFVQYLSRKDTATIIGFIRNQSSNKALIKELCLLNPGLIKALGPDLLLECGIAKADIIKYSDSEDLSMLMYSLAKSNSSELKEFYQVLGTDSQQVASMPNKPVPGDDRYFAMLNKNMSNASTASSNVVGNSRFSEGQTRRKIRPQDVEFWG